MRYAGPRHADAVPQDWKRCVPWDTTASCRQRNNHQGHKRCDTLLASITPADSCLDPQNPIKHSHPIIGHTNHRIAFEPVKLVKHSTEPPKPEKPRPSMFARDAPPVILPPAAKSRTKAKAGPSNAEDVPASAPPTEESDPGAFTFASRSRRGKTARTPKTTVRENPLSNRFVIPTHGEIAEDGIPRIDGQDMARRSKRKPGPKKGKNGADEAREPEVQSEASNQPMQVDADPSMQTDDASSAIAGPSSAPIPTPTPTSHPNHPADHNSSVQRLLMPDAPRGYTKNGLPRKKPGPAKGKKKAETIAREKGGVVSMLTGKLPELADAEFARSEMEVDPQPEPTPEQDDAEKEQNDET